MQTTKLFSDGQGLRELRETLALSLADLSDISGVSKGSIGNYETGARGLGFKSRRALEVALADHIERGGAPPRPQTQTQTFADPGADYGGARLDAPAHLLTPRERSAQYAALAYDAAKARRKSGQFETLMQHVAGVVAREESYDWHKREMLHIVDEHFAKETK